MIDIMLQEKGVRELLDVIHSFYMRELELWVRTDVDAIRFLDDWGSQTSLLIPPPLWRELFKPLYKDYCDIIHANGKFAFMHSDGCISEIIPDLIEIGVDAINSQLFCMDMQALEKTAKGKITFWGEIDRQQILPATDPEIGREAVRKVCQHFYAPAGGIICEFEVGPGCNMNTVAAIMDEWSSMVRSHPETP